LANGCAASAKLAGDILGLLLGIPTVHNPLVASHRGALRPIHPAGRKHPLALH